jgi:hypothetical protein
MRSTAGRYQTKPERSDEIQLIEAGFAELTSDSDWLLSSGSEGHRRWAQNRHREKWAELRVNYYEW